MKFRNPETGEVFFTITGAWAAFMCPGPCGDCNLQIGSTCKREWIESHPREASRLMGYEVVEDEKEEANMDKPRIAQVLGVEVGEQFDIAWLDSNPYHITPEGFLEDKDGYQIGVALSNIINHPYRIIRKPRWTEQEVEDAKTIKRILRATEIKRNRYEDIYAAGPDIADTLLDSEAFPSLRPGETVSLQDIIGGAE